MVDKFQEYVSIDYTFMNLKGSSLKVLAIPKLDPSVNNRRFISAGTGPIGSKTFGRNISVKGLFSTCLVFYWN